MIPSSNSPQTSDDNVLSLDERPHSLVVENVLGEPTPPRGRAVPHAGQIGVEAVPAVDFEVFCQVVGAGEPLFADGTSKKRSVRF